MKVTLGLLGIFLFSNVILAENVQIEKNEDLEALAGPLELIANATIAALIASYADPLSVNATTISGNDAAMNGSLSLSNLSVAGIHGLHLSYIKIKIFTLALNLTVAIPDLVISGKFDGDLTLASLLPVFGDGDFSLAISGSSINVSGKANLTSGFSVSNASIDYNIGDINVNLTGLFNNNPFSELLSKAINDNLTPFLNNNEKLLAGIINSVLNGASTVEEAVSKVAILAVKSIPQSTQRLIGTITAMNQLVGKQ